MHMPEPSTAFRFRSTAGASFGILGANVPALLRALVACGWFGIQSWIGGWAIYKILAIYIPSWDDCPRSRGSSINVAQAGLLPGVLGDQHAGDLPGHRLDPLVAEHQGAALDRAGAGASGLGLPRGERIRSDAVAAVAVRAGRATRPASSGSFFFPALTGIIGFWATLSLNIPDFTRYARSQRDQVLGQALGLPLTMALYSFIGVAVTSATNVIYGKSIWDPVEVLSRFRNPFVLSIGNGLALPGDPGDQHRRQRGQPGERFRASLAAADLVPTGGLITGVLGNSDAALEADRRPDGLHLPMAGRLFVAAGAVGGILITDYYRPPPDAARSARRCIRAADHTGTRGGFNPLALVALAAGIAPCVPGFLGTIDAIKVAPIWISLYHYAWFISFAISAVCYARSR